MSWNYRVLAHLYNDEVTFMIHEVYYYSKNKKPRAYSTAGSIISGESIGELKAGIDRFQEAITKPILWSGKKFPNEYK